MKKTTSSVEEKIKVVRSINKNIRSSTRKLNPILKAIVGKKVDIAIRDLTFSDKRISNDVKKKQPANEDNGTSVTSPIVGTAYLAPEPSAKKFIDIGQKIKKGQTIMIVEAMKTMNHVPSTRDGTVSKILVKDGEPVEFGQPLISVK